MAGPPARESQAMPAQRFLEVLQGSGLVDEGRCQQLRAEWDTASHAVDSGTIADALVDDGTLTPFQAQRLLHGRTTGWVIGRYVILDVLGAGGMGSVFRARHRLMDRIVALKIITPEGAENPEANRRFLDEMRLVARLDHPNVVRAFDADLHDGLPYIVMEYVKGRDLGRIAHRSGPMPIAEVVDAAIQAAWGLHHAHEVGILHRDVKPSNLIRDAAGVVKVLDLGIGVLLDEREIMAERESRRGKLVGTIEYMAPEQARCLPLDPRTDIFGLGCTVYFLLTGAYPYPGKDRTERLAARVRSRPVPIAAVRPELPRGLTRIIDTMLAVRPEDRHATAGDVAKALESWRDASHARREASPTPAATGSRPGSDLPLVNWDVIERALAPAHDLPEEETDRADRRPNARNRTTLAAHRRTLESDGQDSGRAVEDLYHAELGRLHVAAGRGPVAAESPRALETWTERMERWLEAYISMPVAFQILFPLLFVILLLALALAASMA